MVWWLIMVGTLTRPEHFPARWILARVVLPVWVGAWIALSSSTTPWAAWCGSGTGGGYDMALVKLTSAGSTTWAKRWGGTDHDLPTSIAIDRNGDLLVCGEFWGTTDVGGGSKTSIGGSDMFVAKYSSADGSCRWSRVMGGI